MSQQDHFDRIVSALHDAALADTGWPRASALIDEAVGISGNHLTVISGHTRADAEFLFGDRYNHGEYTDLGREYATCYFSHDERVPRFLRLPDSRLVHVTELYTEQELKTSPTYNYLSRGDAGDGLNVRMDGPDGLHIAWALPSSNDPLGWGSKQLTLLTSLLPHIRQFVRVRQALVAAEALRASLTSLLENTLLGVLSLDRRGTIVEANARALDILRRGDGVGDQDGYLCARCPPDDATLQRLIANALPHWGRMSSGGSMPIQRASGQFPLTLHISPIPHRADFGAQRLAALVLLVDPVERPQIDPTGLATTFGLNPGREPCSCRPGRRLQRPGYCRGHAPDPGDGAHSRQTSPPQAGPPHPG